MDVEGYPRWLIERFDFPARDDLPPAKLTLYRGGKLSPEEVLRGERMTK